MVLSQKPIAARCQVSITLQARHASLASQGKEIVALIELAATSLM